MNQRDEVEAKILEALRTVRDPESGRDVVSLGSVANIAHCDGAVTVTLAPKDAAPPVLDRLRRDALSALEKLPFVTHPKVVISPRVAENSSVAHGGDGMAILAVGSGKGGVGKSTIAVNLAVALARRGARVGLLDADIYGPSIPLMLGARAQPEVIEHEGAKKLQPLHAHGVALMSMGFLVEADKPVIWRGPMLHGALRQFFGDVAWGELDYLVIDLPPGTGDVALTLTQTVTLSGAILVSTPQNVAMADARKALAMFRQTNVPVLGIVENMAGEVFGRGGAAAWATSEGLPCLGSIPLDAAVRESGDIGAPAASSTDSAVAAPWLALADRVAAAVRERNAASPKRKPISIQR